MNALQQVKARNVSIKTYCLIHLWLFCHCQIVCDAFAGYFICSHSSQKMLLFLLLNSRPISSLVCMLMIHLENLDKWGIENWWGKLWKWQKSAGCVIVITDNVFCEISYYFYFEYCNFIVFSKYEHYIVAMVIMLTRLLSLKKSWIWFLSGELVTLCFYCTELWNFV